jgi:hypothetical protein
MKPSAYYDRAVDVIEALVRFTLLARDVSHYLVDRYSERKKSRAEPSKRVNQRILSVATGLALDAVPFLREACSATHATWRISSFPCRS